MAARLLHPHAATPARDVESLRVDVQRTPSGRLTCCYVVEGPMETLQIPADKPPRQVDGLWHATCFELFIRRPGMRTYLEINASPSSEWALYRFDDYRTGMRSLEPETPPDITCGRTPAALELRVTVELEALGVAAHHPLRLGIAAVLQSASGATSCWALTHPVAQPDFHHPDGFVLSLGPA